MLAGLVLLVKSWCWSKVGAGQKLVLVKSWCWSKAGAGKKLVLVKSWCWSKAGAGKIRVVCFCVEGEEEKGKKEGEGSELVSVNL